MYIRYISIIITTEGPYVLDVLFTPSGLRGAVACLLYKPITALPITSYTPAVPVTSYTRSLKGLVLLGRLTFTSL